MTGRPAKSAYPCGVQTRTANWSENRCCYQRARCRFIRPRTAINNPKRRCPAQHCPTTPPTSIVPPPPLASSSQPFQRNESTNRLKRRTQRLQSYLYCTSIQLEADMIFVGSIFQYRTVLDSGSRVRGRTGLGPHLQRNKIGKNRYFSKARKTRFSKKKAPLR